jgi:hypothetical protein
VPKDRSYAERTFSGSRLSDLSSRLVRYGPSTLDLPHSYPLLGRYFRAATSGVIDDEKKISFRLPRTGPPPGISSAKVLMPASDPPTDDA